MTKLEQAARQALEALESCNVGNWSMAFDEFAVVEAITALREALAEQAEQEPVTVLKPWSYGGTTGIHDYLMSDGSIRALTPDEARAINAAPQPVQQEPVCKRCANWGVVPIGDGFSVNPCPDCAATQAVQEPCNWHQDDDDGNWATDCGGIFVIIDGTPRDNEMKFCPYCSNRITEHPYTEEEND